MFNLFFYPNNLEFITTQTGLDFLLIQLKRINNGIEPEKLPADSDTVLKNCYNELLKLQNANATPKNNLNDLNTSNLLSETDIATIAFNNKNDIRHWRSVSLFYILY